MEIIYAIPGLGTTKDLYSNISVANHEIKVLDWPVPEKDLSLESYALKFLDQIDQTKPVNLIGVSFGGMICSELAEKIKVNKLVLISSCKNRTEFPLLLKLVRVIPLYRAFSDSLIRAIAKTKRQFIGFEKSFEPTFVAMIDQMPQNYFSNCIAYILNWERRTNNSTPVHIHGTADRLLIHSKIKNYHPVKGGSHAMVLSDASEINVILNKVMNG
ncbi:MAG: alpha/beta hydrolase [Bacteroidota bacterium]